MNELTNKSSALTNSDRVWGKVTKLAPWVALPVIALPAPVLLFIYSFFAADAAVYVLLALVSLGVGAVIGLLAIIAILMWRRNWLKKLRTRLAADGITVDELPYFENELTTAERKALAAISDSDPLLADAYRETLAMRLTAIHVSMRAKRDLLAVERQLNRLQYIKEANTAELTEQLTSDREKFSRIQQAGTRRRDEALVRLQTIEAAAARGASWAETNQALLRLNAAGDQIPLALELAKLEEEARVETSAVIENEEYKTLTSGTN